MLFFADTADITEIDAVKSTGFLDGVTTNPTLVAKTGRQFIEVISDICSIVDGPVSAEVTALDYKGIIEEGLFLSRIAPNVVVKVPLTLDGLKAVKTFAEKGVRTNVTLCFAPSQALLAAKAGATYVSPFVGRLDDLNLDGTQLVRDIRQMYDMHAFTTKVLAASVRTPNHVTQVAKSGADAATMPPRLIRQLADHPLTTQGLEVFIRDWKATGQSVL